MSKDAHHYNPKTLIYTNSTTLNTPSGYDVPLKPQCASFTPLPEYNEFTQVLKINLTNDKWDVISKPQKVTTYHKQTQEVKEFDDESNVAEEYTLLPPSTSFDEFIEGIWVTNRYLQFNSEEHKWVCSELKWYDTKIIYANRGDTSRSGGYTKEQLDSYAIALCDYTSKDSEGNITVNAEERPSI